MIENWFSVPILYEDLFADVAKIQKEIELALPKVKENNLENPWQDNVLTTFKFGDYTNDIANYNLNTLQGCIEKLAEYYLLKNSMEPRKLKIYNSWFNFYDKGMFQYDHTHQFAKLSGVYYYQTNGKDGNIIFSNPNIYLAERLCDIGIPEVSYSPVVGRVLIFPSWLKHRVLLNKTDSQRISISFNLK